MFQCYSGAIQKKWYYKQKLEVTIRTGQGEAMDGLPKFDLTRGSEDYFARLHEICFPFWRCRKIRKNGT
jgi:hypothetical protein